MVEEGGLWHPPLRSHRGKLGQDWTALEWRELGRFDSRDETDVLTTGLRLGVGRGKMEWE